MEFQGCQGCGGCKTKSQTCILEDDLTPVLQAVRDADLLVLASPVYFGDLSGQLKCFFDRTYSYFNPDFSCRMPPGKRAVMVLIQANPTRTISTTSSPATSAGLRGTALPRLISSGSSASGISARSPPRPRPWMRPPPWPGNWCRNHLIPICDHTGNLSLVADPGVRPQVGRTHGCAPTFRFGITWAHERKPDSIKSGLMLGN